MKDFFKNYKVILTLVLLLGLCLRLMNLNKPEGLWNDEYITYSISMLKFPFDFFDGIRSNCHAPLHYFYLKLWMLIFRDSDFMLRLSSLVPNILGCIVMYFAGKNYLTKNHSTQIGLACAALSALSSFLIYFAQEVRIYSMIFLLSSLILLYSLKTYENPTRKNVGFLTFFSVLLILEHTIGFVFVIFNALGLVAFREKSQKKGKGKGKSSDDIFLPIVAGLILCIPIIPFLFRIFAHPTYFSQWWVPFSWSKICFYFTDLFSPVLKNITNSPVSFMEQIISNNHINIGFVLFAIIPSLIAFVLIIKSNIDSRKIHRYFISVFFATFLTVLIASISGKIVFLTKYLTELYPILILMTAIGWAKLNSNSTKTILATVYIFLSLFFITVSHSSAIRLVREEGQRLPVVAMENMNIQKGDKILYMYYPKAWFQKYYNKDNYLAYSIDKYNFPYVMKTGTTYDAFKHGYQDYRVFF